MIQSTMKILLLVIVAGNSKSVVDTNVEIGEIGLKGRLCSGQRNFTGHYISSSDNQIFFFLRRRDQLQLMRAGRINPKFETAVSSDIKRVFRRPLLRYRR